MGMKKEHLLLLLFLLPLTVWQCGVKEDYDIPGQDSIFLKFLNDNDFEFGTPPGHDRPYRVVNEANEPGGIVTSGDFVTIRYSGYLFLASATTKMGRGELFVTNTAEDAAAGGWPAGESPDTEPLTFRVGAGEVIEGIDLGLLDCAQGDTVHLYLSSDFAYGDQSQGFLKPGTPVVFKVLIDSIRVKK